jgi:hypothetical protein
MGWGRKFHRGATTEDCHGTRAKSYTTFAKNSKFKGFRRMIKKLLKPSSGSLRANPTLLLNLRTHGV